MWGSSVLTGFSRNGSNEGLSGVVRLIKNQGSGEVLAERLKCFAQAAWV